MTFKVGDVVACSIDPNTRGEVLSVDEDGKELVFLAEHSGAEIRYPTNSLELVESR